MSPKSNQSSVDEKKRAQNRRFHIISKIAKAYPKDPCVNGRGQKCVCDGTGCS